jgi:hypothetical protein
VSCPDRDKSTQLLQRITNLGPEIWKRFESLVADLFRQNGFHVEVEKRFGLGKADIFASSASGITAIIEAKLYRYRRVATQTLKNVAILVETLRREAAAAKAVLVTTARLNPLAHAELRSIPNFVVYDFDRLVWLLADHPELATTFDSIIREADAFGRGGDADVKQRPDEEKRPYELDTVSKEGGVSALQPETRGQSLCHNFDELVGAQSTASKEKKLELAREFQRTCIDALKYLFDEDLTAWQDQLTTEARISRFDLVARIRLDRDFWTLLSSDFGARYIVFEFKFYTKKIGQGQILTTEKYLYRAARVLTNLEAWIRRRLRSYLWRQWQNGHNRFNELRRRGVPKFNAAVAAGSPTGFWRMSGHPAVQQALPNRYFDSIGLPRLHVSVQA